MGVPFNGKILFAAAAILLGAALAVHGQEPESTSGADATRRREGASPAPDTAPFDLYGIVRGPLFLAAFAAFALGSAWRIAQYARLTRPPRRRGGLPAARVAAGAGAQGARPLRRAPAGTRRRGYSTIFAAYPVTGAAGLVFHLLLFLTPLALPAHNILLGLAFEVSLPWLPGLLLDRLTLVLLAVCGFFLLRRVIVRRVRALTTLQDYLVLLLAATPFASAYLAYH